MSTVDLAEAGSTVRQTCSNPDSAASCCMTLGKLPYLSPSQNSHLKVKYNTELRELMGMKDMAPLKSMAWHLVHTVESVSVRLCSPWL